MYALHPGHREAVQRAITLAGGLGFIRSGETVLLKPAVNSGSRYPATTDPETIRIVAEMVSGLMYETEDEADAAAM